jgi:Protein of unknown function (DUF3052)
MGFRPTKGSGRLSPTGRNCRHAEVSRTAGPEELKAPVGSKLNLAPGMVVQELGWDEDVDDDVRLMIEDSIDGELIEEAVEAVDVVMLWWREGDGDLVDGLVDALTDLSDTGYIWLMTPKVGRPGYVDAADLAEAAVTAGLALTNSASVSTDWAATRLVRPRGARR